MSTPKTEIKSIKHTFEPEERNNIGSELARAIGGLRGIEAEFDQVKAGYKAKTTASEAQIDKLSTDLVNGFEMRNKKCVVVYRPRDRKKDFIIEDEFALLGKEAAAALTEDMTPSDFQADLIEAESIFSNREEIAIIPPAGQDRGILVIGQLQGKWYSALRVNVGTLRLEERLDSEQAAFKKRFDAIQRSGKRLLEWLTDQVGKDTAKGFVELIDKAVAAHKERVE